MDEQTRSVTEMPQQPASGPTQPVAGGTAKDERRLLRRSKKDRIIAGVAGGLARYFDLDPVIFRIAFLLLLIPGGIGLLIYIICWIAMPEFKTVEEEVEDSARARPVSHGTAGLIVGGALVLLGAFILLEPFINWLDIRIIGGALLIIFGAIIVIRGVKSE
jgi:phage shock protein C